MTLQHIQEFFEAAGDVTTSIDCDAIKGLVNELASVRSRQGRIFVLGVGGSAATASHAVNDLRKLCGIEAYAPTDNASEVTARTNDEGWDSVFVPYLDTSHLGNYDAVFILSVGGGDLDRNISANLVKAVDFAIKRGARVLGIVGRKDGYASRYGHAVVNIPMVKGEWLTPLAESFAMVVLHCLVSHPQLQRQPTKW